MAPRLGRLSAPEERSLQRTRLGRGQSGPRQYLDDLVGNLTLRRREWRRVALPAQASLDVRPEPGRLLRYLIRTSVQVSDLLEKRLELLVVDRHAVWKYDSNTRSSFACHSSL